ncbi:nephrocystin-4-like protein [Phytophthora cinnamomi]|uniref:nephrocystin-4-like protein n=1 Tax=Phytophthora cinnamomi TaxID=4785 RepID=UPI00355A2652|nr:nephrocystin-4-like protein [Phytophthora cinnamomi]
MVARARQASAASRATSSAVSSPSSSSFEDSFASSESDSPSESEFSTDSEAHSAPSVRRARAARVSRRRWQKAQNQSGSTTALLPPAEPASTSLWTTREKQFEKFRSSLLSMPVPDGVVRVEKAKGYSLHVMSVMNWVLPDSILHTSAIPAASGANEQDEEDEEEPLITLGVHVSLFHATSKRFFGNTWVSPELAVDPFHIKQARHPKDGTLRYVIENALLNFRAYFISDIIDANCVGVMELVAYEKDPDSKATVRVVGCGWTLLPLFARQQPVQSGAKDESSSVPSAFSLNTSGDSVSVFTGSPRALWELNPDTWSAQEKHEGCKFYYQLVQYEPMMSIAMFLRKTELVGALDPIPGLKNGNLANIDMGKNPKMLLHEEADTTYEETLASFVKIASLVPKSVQIEEPFELDVVATRVAINLRDEIEANLVARLRISRKAIHEGATSVEGEVSARVLKIALHNGRCFRTRQFTVPLKADPNGGDTLLCVRNHSKLRGFVFHPNMAIIVVLQYTVHFRIIWPSKLKQQTLEAKKPPLPEEDVVLVTMGARALVPSDGKKLYLYDKHHHATAISAEPLTTLGGVLLQEQEEHRRVLHVDLLSGAPCRPYSDNTLYTPPDQVTRSLQNREPSTKDSFAFCDLRITIDEDVPAPGPPIEETKAPASPVKPAVDESNQTNDDNEDCAADQWARKLLGKANSNPVLAQTLNALATSPTAKDKPADPPPRTPSPTKKQQAERPADPTTLVPDAPTSELSRASKTLLTRYGYMESHDKPPSSPTNNQMDHDKRKRPKKVEIIAKSIETEVKDPFKANEIRFHFAAYRACSPGAEVKTGMHCSPAPARVYFTFQFYNFPPTRTETLRLSKAFDNGAGGEIQTFLLMRDSTANKPSLAIQFDVDTTSTMNPLETRRFAEYLKWNNLYVDVWDADSLFQLGTFAIPLHELLRQGNSVKKFQAEVEIAPPLGGTLLPDHTGDDEGSAICTVPDTRGGVDSPSVGRVQLLMSSYGLKGENYIDQETSNQTGAVQSSGAQPAPIEDHLEPSRKPKHRVRARTLVESNPELYRLLSQEGFYGDRTGKELRERREAQPLQQKGFGSVNTLTPKEIAILCELFGSRKAASASSSAGNRPTRIKCDMEGKTGLLALLSLRPPEAPVPVAASVAKPVEDQPAASVKAPEVQQKQQPQQPSVATSDHAQRLKRVLNIATKNQLVLSDAFGLFDVNKDGFLSRDEFIKAMRSLGAVFDDLSDDDLGLLADLLDKNKDGKIEYREFSQFLDTPSRMPKGEWRDHIKRIVVRAMEKGIRVHHIFVEIDASGDGKLSYEEFERGLNQLGVSTSGDKESVQDLIAELDKDHDGTISYVEFLESLGISVEDNKKEVVNETVKDIKADVHKILSRLEKKGISFEEVFTHFDADRNGTLSVEEFTQALNQLLKLNAKSGESDSDDTLKEFERNAVEVYVKTINSDGDMKIDYPE